MSFGAKLQTARKKLDISQEDLAGILNVQRNTVWRWENNRATPGSNLAAKIAQALNTTTDYLLGEMDNPAPEPVIETKKMQPREGLPVSNECYIEEAAVNKRGELKYTFANGDKLEIPDTPEGRALFERIVFKNSSPETCLKKQ